MLPCNVIPVVLNGVNMSKIAPPHSYIDIKEFKNFSGRIKINTFYIGNEHFSLLDFALHIQRVSRDPSLFASYFWWKKYYKIEPCNHHIICHKKLFEKVSCLQNSLSPHVWHLKAFCSLCSSLHKASNFQNTSPTQKHEIKKWWNGADTCKTFGKNLAASDEMWNMLPK